MLFRWSCWAVLIVVPEPRKGSSTVSPVKLKSWMRRRGISSGKAAMPFSNLAAFGRTFVMSQTVRFHFSDKYLAVLSVAGLGTAM